MKGKGLGWLGLIIIMMGVYLAVIVQANSIIRLEDYGARGDDNIEDTIAMEGALEECKRQKGCTLQVSIPGVYLLHPFNLTSNLYLHLTDGVIFQSVVDSIDQWPVLPRLRSYDTSLKRITGNRLAPFIGGFNLTNITMRGGVYDGGGSFWWTRADLMLSHFKLTRPCLFELELSRNIRIENLVLRNSPFWTAHITYSNEVSFRKVRVFNPHDSPNTDGIVPDSSTDVRIEDCDIETGSDAIAIKSGFGPNGRDTGLPSTRIDVRRVRVLRARGAFTLGSELAGGAYDIRFTNSMIQNSISGIRLKSGYDDVGGEASRIVFSNLLMEKVHKPISIYMLSSRKELSTNVRPSFSKIKIMRIRAYGVTIGNEICCLRNNPCNEIIIKDSVFSGNFSWNCCHIDKSWSEKVEPAPLKCPGFKIREDNMAPLWMSSPLSLLLFFAVLCFFFAQRMTQKKSHTIKIT